MYFILWHTYPLLNISKLKIVKILIAACNIDYLTFFYCWTLRLLIILYHKSNLTLILVHEQFFSSLENYRLVTEVSLQFLIHIAKISLRIAVIIYLTTGFKIILAFSTKQIISFYLLHHAITLCLVSDGEYVVINHVYFFFLVLYQVLWQVSTYHLLSNT